MLRLGKRDAVLSHTARNPREHASQSGAVFQAFDNNFLWRAPLDGVLYDGTLEHREGMCPNILIQAILVEAEHVQNDCIGLNKDSIKRLTCVARRPRYRLVLMGALLHLAVGMG